MTKSILAAVAFLLAASASVAQTKLQTLLNGPQPTQHPRVFQVLLRAQASAGAAKTNAQTQRIVGSSAYNQGVLYDSARYVYNSAARGSHHAPNDLNSYDFRYYPTDIHFPDVADVVAGGELDIQCDTAVFRAADGVYRTVGLQYNTAHQPTLYYSAYLDPITGGSDGRERFTMTYGVAGRRTLMLAEVDTAVGGTPGAFLADYRMHSFYGGSPMRPLRDSFAPAVGAPITTDAIRYVYNYAGNNLASIDLFEASGSTFTQSGSFLFTYDGVGRLLTQALVADIGNGFQPLYKDSVTYTGSLVFPISIYTSGYNGATFQPVSTKHYTVNAQNLRDTLRVFDGMGSLLAIVRYQYNSYGNPAAYSIIDPTTSATVPAETGRYYYELHDPTRLIPPPDAGLAAVAWPNPVAEELMLRWTAMQGRMLLQLADASGRVVEDWCVPALSGTAKVDMRHYAPGVYFLLLRNDEGTAMQHLKLTKS